MKHTLPNKFAKSNQIMYYLFFAPDPSKHTDFIRSFKTLTAAKNYIKKDCSSMRRKYPGEEWLESYYFLAKRMK